MCLENSDQRVGRLPSGGDVARIYQSSGRVPWLRAAGCMIATLAIVGLAGWLPVAAFAAEPTTIEQQVTAHLDAGEFGAALDAANKAENADAKNAVIEKG